MDATEVVPFGKYRGRPVSDLAADPSYCQWLAGQDWFRQKFIGIHTLIVNNFSQPQDTPEHNAMQAKFLRAEVRESLLWKLASREKCIAHLVSKCQEAASVLEAKSAAQRKRAQANRRIGLECFGSWERERREKTASAEELQADELAESAKQIADLAATPKLSVSSDVKFENKGWDVTIDACIELAGCEGACFGPGMEHIELRQWPEIFCELKPLLGDDWPTVLRQIKRRGRERGEIHTLVYGEYTGTGATLEQVVAIFMTDRIRTVSMTSIEQAQLPLENNHTGTGGGSRPE